MEGECHSQVTYLQSLDLIFGRKLGKVGVQTSYFCWCAHVLHCHLYSEFIRISHTHKGIQIFSELFNIFTFHKRENVVNIIGD
jgi:hypothetical protein